jgi:hypothetical protein
MDEAPAATYRDPSAVHGPTPGVTPVPPDCTPGLLPTQAGGSTWNVQAQASNNVAEHPNLDGRPDNREP